MTVDGHYLRVGQAFVLGVSGVPRTNKGCWGRYSDEECVITC